MDEKMGGRGEMRSPLLTRIENFWYHYKWPFLAGLLALVVLTVSLVQCARNGKGDDAYLMYAGGHVLTGTARRDLEQSVSAFSEDRNGDGKVVVAIGEYSIFTLDEINEKYKPDDRAHVMQLSQNNRETFDQEILAGGASLCFLSPSLFEDVVKTENKTDGNRLLPVSEYYPGAAAEDCVQYGGISYGVRLASLPLYTYPGFSTLPEDTILCVRARVSMNSLFGGQEAETLYEANLALAKRLVVAPAYVAE